MSKLMHAIGEFSCPHCGVGNMTIYSGDTVAPLDGDISICAYCRLPTIVSVGFKTTTVRKPVTLQEWTRGLEAIDEVTDNKALRCILERVLAHV